MSSGFQRAPPVLAGLFAACPPEPGSTSGCALADMRFYDTAEAGVICRARVVGEGGSLALPYRRQQEVELDSCGHDGIAYMNALRVTI